MANLNKVTLIGRLGQDPEIRYTQSGNSVANATIATNDYWTDKQGEKQERTEWHSLVMWGKLADLAQSYLKKGSQVYVEGRLQTRDWEDQQGQKHYKTEVVVTTMQFLDSRISDSEPAQAAVSTTYTYNIVSYSTVARGTAQYSTVQYSTVQYSTVQYSIV